MELKACKRGGGEPLSSVWRVLLSSSDKAAVIVFSFSLFQASRVSAQIFLRQQCYCGLYNVESWDLRFCL